MYKTLWRLRQIVLLYVFYKFNLNSFVNISHVLILVYRYICDKIVYNIIT